MSSDSIRALVVFGILLVVLMLWSVFFTPKSNLPRPPVSPVTLTAPNSTPASAGTDSQSPPQIAERPNAPLQHDTAFTLENSLLRVRINSIGAGFTSILLKRYQAELVIPSTSLLTTRLIVGHDSSTPGLALETLNLASIPVRTCATENRVELVWTAPPGTVRKVWSLGPDYTLDCSLSLPPACLSQFDCIAGIRSTEVDRKDDLANFHFCVFENNRFHQISASALRKKLFNGRPNWVGLRSKYFLLAIISQQEPFSSTTAWALTDGRCGFRATTEQNSTAFRVYVGPIEYGRLRPIGLGFEKMVSLGWIKQIALAILWLLNLFDSILRSWGLAIIAFSTLMKLIFYPLTRIQTRQMRQMQLLQPKINELREKYKDEPQVLNQETMRLYRLYKVNPLSGCLPLLIQMPVFFALYAVLRNFIELRGARFLWLDLSRPDTLLGHIPIGVPLLGGAAIGLLPLLMGASFIAQNLMTSADKRNWAMTILFPVFITAIFLNLSSGLQLYWFIYNVISILEATIAARGDKLWRKRISMPVVPRK
ncbi:MAG: membrane protein insertase YidC [candidate division WOR-3 bacterium]